MPKTKPDAREIRAWLNRPTANADPYAQWSQGRLYVETLLAMLAEKDAALESMSEVLGGRYVELRQLTIQLQQANERAEKAEAALAEVAMRLQEQANHE